MPRIASNSWSYSASRGFASPEGGTYSRNNLVVAQADSLLPKEYIFFLVTRLLFLSLQGYSTHLASLDYPVLRIVVSRIYTAESSRYHGYVSSLLALS